MKRLILVACIFVLTKCSISKVLIAEDFLISMDKGACFGSCPVYSLTIDYKGTALFQGERFTDKIGKHALNIPQNELQELAKAFQDADLQQFDDEYGSSIADLPLITIGYTNQGITKTIKGKLERPQTVKNLQVLLEGIAHREGWTSLDTLEPVVKKEVVKEEEPKEIIIPSELVIKFNEGTIISRWIRQFREYEMYVQKPLTDDRRTWIVQYNTKKIDPADLLSRLRSDSEIESVDFNKKTNQ